MSVLLVEVLDVLHVPGAQEVKEGLEVPYLLCAWRGPGGTESGTKGSGERCGVLASREIPAVLEAALRCGSASV